MRAFAQRRHHSRASVAHHEQLAIFSMNRAEPSVNVQVRLKYQDYLKNPVELGPGMHHRSARPHQAADTSAPEQPARTRTLGTIRLRGGRGGSLGPRGHAAGVMAGRCGSARHAGGCAAPAAPLVLAADGERPKDSRRARSRQRSSPASSSNRGADNNHYFSTTQHTAKNSGLLPRNLRVSSRISGRCYFSKSMLGFRARCGVHR